MRKSNALVSALVLLIFFSSCQKADLQTPLTNAQLAKGGVPGKQMLTVGSFYGGGVVVHLDETGQHGLIAALQDVGPAPWGCDGTLIPDIDLYDYFASGQQYTRQMLAYCNEPGTVARLCDELVVRDRGDVGRKYDDWYMPTSNEFNYVLAAANDMDNPEFTASFNYGYWLPFQWGGTFQAAPVDPSHMAHLLSVTYYGEPPYQNWITFIQTPLVKTALASVRPVRSF